MIAIAHDRDVDGLVCHAILRRHATKAGKKMRHLLVDYVDLCSKLAELGDLKGEEIVIADLGYSKLVGICRNKIEELARNNSVVWFDHHDWSGIKRPSHVKLHVDMALCASELVQKAYLPEDKIAAEMAALARAHDFARENELAWKIYDVISSGFSKPRLVELFAKGVFWNEELEEAHRKYQEVKEKGFSYLEEHSKLYRLGEWTCLLGYSPQSLSSTLAAGRLLRRNTDFVICVWPNGKLSFRRNNEEVNLREMALLFDGGGRGAAAGGTIEGEVTEDNYIKVFDLIMERVSMGYEERGRYRVS